MATNRPTPTQIIAGRRDWRALLESEYSAVSIRLQAAYARTLLPIRARVTALVAELDALEAAGTLTPQGVRGLRAYQALLTRIEAEMADFAVIARSEAANAGSAALQLGLGFAEDAVIASGGSAAQVLAGVWLRPDPAALARLIDYADSGAMRAALERFGANAANNFADTLLALTAQGRGSREMARLMTRWLDVPYAWADNAVRTTLHYSYRGATHAAYLTNERVVEGWHWASALDARACLSCISQHGSFHPVTEILNDHHRGRCFPIPLVRGSTRTMGRGEDWYARLPEGAQRRVAGDLMYTALRDGAVRWEDLSRPYQNDVFGTMLREANVAELVPNRRTYVELQRRALALPRNPVNDEQAAVIAAEARAR
jgi:hypothetical protein